MQPEYAIGALIQGDPHGSHTRRLIRCNRGRSSGGKTAAAGGAGVFFCGQACEFQPVVSAELRRRAESSAIQGERDQLLLVMPSSIDRAVVCGILARLVGSANLSLEVVNRVGCPHP